jgi:tRNA threonylcarbamoyladenosine biosynthesis protein TsaE
MTESPEATAALAQGLAALLRPKDIVLLRGELGAGKTTFTRALVAFFSPRNSMVSSPTFVMVNQYPVSPPVMGINDVTHVDAYRLRSAADLDSLGWDQLFDGAGFAAEGTIGLIEWPERIAEALPDLEKAVSVELFHAGPTAREFRISLPESFKERPETKLFLEREPMLCPATKVWVSPLNPAYPFANERARMADLGKWLSGSYTISRPVENDDFSRGE